MNMRKSSGRVSHRSGIPAGDSGLERVEDLMTLKIINVT